MSKYGKECPKCSGYMHRCEEYVPAVYEGQTIVTPAKGCMGQSLNLMGGRNHEVGNWWRCLFCDLWEPLEAKKPAAVSA